jgi:penicillin-binding protein 2
MKATRWLLTLLVIGMAACTPKPSDGSPNIFSIFASPTPLPTAIAGVTPAPAFDASSAMAKFLEAEKNGDFVSMYAMLSKASQASIKPDDFTKKYMDALEKMGAAKLDYEVHTQTINPNTAKVGFSILYHTALFGDIQRDISADLNKEGGSWVVDWNAGLILPELATGNHLATDYQIPSRGNIYDRNGLPIVAQTDAYALGITPGKINPNSENLLVGELAKMCGLTPDSIKASYANAAPDWYVGVCEVTTDQAKNALDLNLGGLIVTPYNSRFYNDGGIAPQVVGYTQLISKDQLDHYLRLGYRGDERVGQAGIEKSMETDLAGKHGGTLYIADPSGQLISKLGSSDPQPANSVYLTIDQNLQYYAQQSLTGFNGAVVVMERDTGRVLAMASSPGYDPNLFDPNNFNSNSLINSLLSNTDQPLVNRAAQDQYPLGSVFKIITMSAALESGLYLPQTTYDCPYHFTELNGVVLNDWTWDYCQTALKQGKQCNTPSTTPSGVLTLQQGLMRSCDPYFWHIGLDLFNNNRGSDIENMARAFGLGAPTGINAIAEATGTLAVPTEPLEATNQAIGQGDVLVTPLQVARFVAAVGNGGTLFRPQLIEKIQPVNGNPTSVFKPDATGTLPLRPDNLAALQESMNWVITNPLGTAYYRLFGLSLPMAGKTGTAQAGTTLPDAWFAGYTMDAQNSSKPDIAVAVLVENAGEGSDYAAPLFRAIIETYYYGKPQVQPWFGPIGNPFTPTPLGGIPTRTPKPPKGQNVPTP